MIDLLTENQFRKILIDIASRHPEELDFINRRCSEWRVTNYDNFELFVEHIQKGIFKPTTRKDGKHSIPHPTVGISVDASIRSNPGGRFFYRGVDLKTKEMVFDFTNELDYRGTNNIAEFLAVVDGMRALKDYPKEERVIYSDSINALRWVKNKQCKTNFQYEGTADLITSALEFLHFELDYEVSLRHWDKIRWGEPLSDYGLKKNKRK